MDLVGTRRATKGNGRQAGWPDRGRLRPLPPTAIRCDQGHEGLLNPPTGSSPTDFGGAAPGRRGSAPVAKLGHVLGHRLPTQKNQGKAAPDSDRSRLHRFQKSIAPIGTFDDWKSAILSSQDLFFWTEMQVRSIIITRCYVVDWGKCVGGWLSAFSAGILGQPRCGRVCWRATPARLLSF